MQFHRPPPECRLDGVAARVGFNAQNQVIIFRHDSFTGPGFGIRGEALTTR